MWVSKNVSKLQITHVWYTKLWHNSGPLFYYLTWLILGTAVPLQFYVTFFFYLSSVFFHIWHWHRRKYFLSIFYHIFRHYPYQLGSYWKTPSWLLLPSTLDSSSMSLLLPFLFAKSVCYVSHTWSPDVSCPPTTHTSCLSSYVDFSSLLHRVLVCTSTFFLVITCQTFLSLHLLVPNKTVDKFIRKGLVQSRIREVRVQTWFSRRLRFFVEFLKRVKSSRQLSPYFYSRFPSYQG